MKTILGNGTSCFAYLVVVCLVMWKFTKASVNFVRNSHQIRTQFTLHSHSQVNKQDARLDPCEWKKNGDSEAIVHQGLVILGCGTQGNISVEFLGTQLPCNTGGKGDFTTKHGPIHTRFNARSKGMSSPIHKGYI